MIRCFRNLPNTTEFWLASAGIVLGCGILSSIAAWDWLRSGTLGGAGESNSTTIRNVGFLLAGVLALVFAVWRGVLAHRQSETAEQGLVNERYQTGAEMLGSDVLAVRLGGIYALQRLAEDHPEQYHIQIMRLLCSFVRFPTEDQKPESGQATIEPESRLGVRQDVEATMQALCFRSKRQLALELESEFRIDLRGANLHDTQVVDANLSRAMLHHANLSNVNLANTDLTDAYLSYANLSQAEFHNVNCTRTRFRSTDLSWAMLQDANLPRTDFHSANLACANLFRSNLSGASFQHANATNACLERARLSKASFLGTDLSGAYIAGADLSGAHFSDADLNQASLLDADLSGADFSAGGRRTAKGLTQAQLDQARAEADRPPRLDGVFDAETGVPLVWRGQPVDPGP